ncbi:undecaprenyl pyrophosphate synthase [Companilactobacillus paralimentarius DSM 13238 = JCM 10415]|jgi:undecaprenyl diphosphate synthase|uniref:Isoprenyl transferase n=1 Tax=Companilactobacillus paralimentarius DSM 13238 = JCM 10415 TaxID=1122151 RepID=A0A0R1PC12_9LACO|nr:isoprenyl transferase [Companilactobacillus paralimentarius]KAE9564866.1 UDP pyrophosphate synthase [Companilactobacillus paralimentarius]KRL30007.1 undecaprenyl pyrophosphate synthase [Companilactobacillus paralimentarius DSM 13238 = JCM 10415]MDR4934258.1 isoprenyl transferase [Companilactobacillus paralimentarius]QFR68507.1 isoprenyl transferase [Companilactobacillus paralimentarius]
MTESKRQLDSDISVPKHIAIIMDGNGRWAKKKGQPRIAGHKEGMNNVKTIATAASHLGVKVLSLYAFSTENWSRPSKEVNFLMKLPVDFFGTFMPDLIKENIRVFVTGFTDHLPDKTRKVVLKAVEDTKGNTGMILNFAFNYGGRAEIVNAAKNLAIEAASGSIDPSEINDTMFADHLLTNHLKELADPDLLIRTSGEERISNFMLWQLAYTEMIFDDSYWPDFTVDDLVEDIKEFDRRDRRYGSV